MANEAPELSAAQLMIQGKEAKASELPTDSKKGQENNGSDTAVVEQRGPKLSELRTQGEHNQEVAINDVTRTQLIDRLTNRINTLRELKARGQKLSDYDEFIIGSDIVNRLKNAAELTKSDYAVMYSSIQDELIQKAGAAGVLIEDLPATFGEKKRWPRKSTDDVRPGIKFDAVDVSGRMRTPYLDQLNYYDQLPDQIEGDLEELNLLRIDLEESLWDGGYTNPLFEPNRVAAYPATTRGGQNRYHNEFLHQQKELMEQAGHSAIQYADLLRDNPTEAARLSFEANRRALFVFAGELGQEILKDKKPPITKDALIDQVAAIRNGKVFHEGDAGWIDPTVAEHALKDAEEVHRKAEAELKKDEDVIKSLNDELEKLKSELPTKQKEVDSLKKTWTAIQKNVKAQITSIDTSITTLSARIASLPPGANPKDISPLAGQIVALESAKAAQYKIQTDLLTKQANAQVDLVATRARITAIPAEVTTAETKLLASKASARAAEADVKVKKAALNEIEEANKGITHSTEPTAVAIEKWAKVLEGDNYSKIIGERFKGDHTGEFTRSNLSRTTIDQGGQVVGAEALRRHIFEIADPTKYDPEVSRKMLSDETIARGLLYQLQINVDRLSDGGTPLIDLLTSVDTHRAAIAALDKTHVDYGTNLDTHQAAIRAAELDLVKSVLPDLGKKSEFEVGNFVRFLTHEGLKSAARGNPYLEFSNADFLKIDQEAKETQTAESIINSEDLGKTTITDNSVSWEGKAKFAWATPREAPGAGLAKLSTRITQEFGRDSLQHGHVDYVFEVKTNLRLLQSLPEVATPGVIPEEIRKAFYDINGNLRQELRAGEKIWQALSRGQATDGIPPWIKIGNATETDDRLVTGSTGDNRAAAKFYDTLNTRGGLLQIDAGAQQNMAASIAEKVISMPPSKRQDVLRGASTRFQILGVPVTGSGTTKDYEVDFDKDGKILIGDAGGAPKQEIEHFMDQRLRELQEIRATQNLAPADQTAIRNEYMSLLLPLGRQILIGQERKR